jgi:hypothetical protein
MQRNCIIVGFPINREFSEGSISKRSQRLVKKPVQHVQTVLVRFGGHGGLRRRPRRARAPAQRSHRRRSRHPRRPWPRRRHLAWLTISEDSQSLRKNDASPNSL